MTKKDIPLNNDANTKTFSVKVPTWSAKCHQLNH